jgi:asparagine synthase (glutamine-hydrolysing)
MCGIAGILHWGGVGDAPVRIRRMAMAQRHRGPDDYGEWADPDIALGFRRLSILDLVTGAQPMANEDRSVQVVFNGEIYNHRDLRRELEAAGHLFRSDHSDTEVLVHGWEQWGERLPERLNGMFAFAVWDQRRRSLFLARDRYGIKPLYVARRDDALLFASELRALFQSGLIERRESPEGVLEYLTLMNNWHGRTPFADVAMLSPGVSELVARAGTRRRTHWTLSFPRSRRASSAQAAGEHREILLGVLRRQINADVPVMTYLSGGIDSAAVTAAAYKLNHSVQAYSCIFDLDGVGEDRIVDEREFSREAARFLGIPRIELELSADALTTALDATVAALEYPRMGMSYVNYLIAGRVARDAKVVLSGMGGDELHGGYLARYQNTPAQRAPTAGLLHYLYRRLRRHPAVWAADPFAWYRRALNVPLAVGELDIALTPEFRRATSSFSPIAAIEEAITASPSAAPWDTVMFVDFTTYLHGLLVLEDKLSMAHSLETRVPLLDNELVDAMLDLPWEHFCDGRTGKKVFRESVKPWVPESIYTKKKMGFGPPDASWYRGALQPWIERQLSPATIAARGILRPEWVKQKLDEHFAGRANNVAIIWCLLSLESWCRQNGMFGGAFAAAASPSFA